MEERDDRLTTVRLATDVTLTGAVAQLSRGLLPEVSKKHTQQFAECLRATFAGEQEAEPTTGCGD
jgi:carbon monoxide dehydrogenase subunit G